MSVIDPMPLPHAPLGNLIALTGPDPEARAAITAMLCAQHYTLASVRAAVCVEVADAWAVDIAVISNDLCRDWPVQALAIDRCNSNTFQLRMADAIHGIDVRAPRSPDELVHWWQHTHRAPDYWANQLQARIARKRGRIVVPDAINPQLQSVALQAGAELWHIGPGSTPGAHSHCELLPSGAWMVHQHHTKPIAAHA